jgi:predicted O-methyltransferase YrrM
MKIDNYIMNLMPERDEIQKEMEKYAKENNFPIIGPMVGRILRQLAIVTGAKNIFEMGSGYGYSAYWFAGGIPEDGKIICTDGSEENMARGLEYLRRGGFMNKIEYQTGNALDIIKKYDVPFDIILNDIDKKDYPLAFELAIPRLKKGGIFVTDNVLWKGKILHKRVDSATRAVAEFNQMLFSSKDVLSSIIPIRDGLGLAVKII